MNAKRRVRVLSGAGTLALSAVLAGASLLCAQDWPQWRGQGRDGKASHFAAPKTWPPALVQKWRVTVGAGDATPALVGDRLYVFARQADEEALLCLSAADGKQIWRDCYAAQAVTGAASRHPGPRGSPAVAEGKVVTLGVGGVLSCLDAATGKLLWRRDEFPKVVPQFFTGMSPLIVDGLCIAHLGGRDNGAVIAFDLATGQPKWKWSEDGPAYGSPVLMTVDGLRQVVTITEKRFVGLSLADGKLLWQVPAPTQFRFYNSATPVVDGQVLYLTGQGRGTKAVRIEEQASGMALKELWTNEKLGTGFNTPVLKDGLLFGMSDRGSFFCVGAKDGQTCWVDTTTRRENFCAIVDAGPALLALPSDGQLVVLAPSAKQYEELARYKVSDTPVYAHPVVSGERIFIKDRDTVSLWTLQ